MAWDDYEKNGKSWISGDRPIDEMAIALGKIVDAYLSRFDRKPTIYEVLYALKIVLQASPSKYLSDPENALIEKVFNTSNW